MLCPTLLCSAFDVIDVNDVLDTVRLVQLCVRRLPSCVPDQPDTSDTSVTTSVSTLSPSVGKLSAVASVSGGVSVNVSVGVVSACLLTSLRLLLNVTHENGELSAVNPFQFLYFRLV